MKKHIALILALVMCISLFPAVSAQTAGDSTGSEPVEAFEHEYIFKLDAFNTDKMIKGSSSASEAPYHTSAPVLSLSNGALYYRDAMD